MNRLLKTLISGATGTTLMTAASALMSLLPKEEFREPDQLGKMAERILPVLSKSEQAFLAWAAHYSMGSAFAAVYVDLWEKQKMKCSLKNGVVLGVISGVLGIMIWKASFSLHPLPPNNRKLDFYLQRIPAHVVFALFATIAYQQIKKKEQRK